MKRYKKYSALLLACLMVITLSVTALAAEVSDAASTLRLERTEGTVTVENASGKNLTVRKAMRLYSGYGVETASASYAWISLDSSKAIKLDASSEAEVAKSGKKLEVRLNSGKLFFNVTLPLEADETLDIRTSTMVTGVRGTSGWVEVVDRSTVRISLLEGELTIVSIDPETGAKRTTVLTGGHTLTIVYHGDELVVESGLLTEDEIIRQLIENGVIRQEYITTIGPGLRIEELQEEDVPGFVAVEVANDIELQKKITETTELSVPEIIDRAEERLAAEEETAAKEEERILEELDSLHSENVDPLFDNQQSRPSAGGTGGGTVPPVVEEETPFTLPDNPTTAEVQQALAEGYTVLEINHANQTLADDGVSQRLSLANVGTTGADIPANITFNINSGSVAVEDGETLDIEGTLNINTETAGAELTPAGMSVGSGGTVNINSADSLHVKGTLTNNGTINVGMTAEGLLSVEGSGMLVNNNTINVGTTSMGRLSVIDNGSISGGDNPGTINVGSSGTLSSASDLISQNVVNQTGGSVEMTLVKGGSTNLNNAGTMTLNMGENVFLDDPTLTNTGKLTINGGSITNDTVTLQNDGTLTLTDCSITANSTEASGIINNGTLSISSSQITASKFGIQNYGEVTIEAGAVISAEYAIYNTGSGTVNVNNGNITGSENGINSDSGTVNIFGGNITTTAEYSETGNSAAIYIGANSELHCTGGQIDGGKSYGVRISNSAKTSTIAGTTEITGAVGLVTTQSTSDDTSVVEVSGDAKIRSSSDSSGIWNYGILKMSGGAASGTQGIQNGGTVEFSGGTAEGTIGIVNNDGTLTVSGGTITGTTYGINNLAADTDNIPAVTITGEKATTIKGATAIYNTNGTLVIGTEGNSTTANNNVTISSTAGTSTDYSSAIYNFTNVTDSIATTTIHGGTFTSNAVLLDENGANTSAVLFNAVGGDSAAPSVLNIYGGAISHTAKGIGVSNNGTLTVSGTPSITGGIENDNTLTLDNATVSDITNNTDADAYVTGTSTVSGNITNSGTFQLGDGTTTGTLYLDSATVDGGITIPADSTVYVTGQTSISGIVSNSGTFQVGDGTKAGELLLTGAASGNEIKVLEGSSMEIEPSNGIFQTSSNISNAGTLTLSGGQFQSYITNSGTMTVTGSSLYAISGKAITNTGNLTVSGGSIDGISNRGTAEINGENAYVYYGITNSTGGTLTVNNGNISNADNNRSAISNSGTLYVNGGNITDGNDPAITNNSSGEATITAGAVSGLTGIENSGTLTVGTPSGSDNAIDITCTGSSSGAESDNYAISNSGTLTVERGTITATDYSIYNLGTATVNGGVITGGTCGLDNLNKVTVKGGNISGAIALSNLATAGIAEVINGTITGTNIGISNAGTLTVAGGNISGVNSAISNTGGSVDANSGAITYGLTVSGGTITAAAEDGQGDGISNSGYANITGGTITGGTATNGAGIRNLANGTIDIGQINTDPDIEQATPTISGYYGVYNENVNQSVYIRGGNITGQAAGLYSVDSTDSYNIVLYGGAIYGAAVPEGKYVVDANNVDYQYVWLWSATKNTILPELDPESTEIQTKDNWFGIVNGGRG